MTRARTTKKLAQRIDLNYFKRPTPLKRAKFWLSLAIPLLALAWIAWRGFSRDHSVYSNGRLSQAHAVLEKECAVCHVRQAGTFSAKVADNACLDCHDGPIHHANSTKSLQCVACHVEHRGRINISAASNQACAECHANLSTTYRAAAYSPHIHSLENDHPEFAAVRSSGGMPARDPGTIKLNHALHMKPIRRGPTGPNVQLQCGDCHRTEAAARTTSWPYSDPQNMNYSPSYARGLVRDDPEQQVSLRPSKPRSGRELMAPVNFATACSGCHSLAFDKRFEEGVPHDTPDVISAFLFRNFSSYISSHPNELREMQSPDRDLTGKTSASRIRLLTAAQWVAERVAVAEELLWHKTCAQCHKLTTSWLQDTSIGRWDAANLSGPSRPLSAPTELPAAHSAKRPTIAITNVTAEWMPHAKFDHDAHRGFSCVSCHAKALTSTETSDILLPGIAICKTCHAPGPAHAESRCSECHTYHDWSKHKEITPRFTLPALRGGQ